MTLKSCYLARRVSRFLGWWRLAVRGRVDHYSPLVFNHNNQKSVKDFVLEWNETFPIDRWWREKHEIPFNSAQHREVSFLDMRIEWEEDRLYQRLREENRYKINSGNYFKEITKEEDQLSEQEQLKRFMEEEKEIDYSQYDD